MVPIGRQGLSPHVRGNLSSRRLSSGFTGSIPARAGEPQPPWSFTRCVRVYPRTCGGTSHASLDPAGERGLSPHVRGNPVSTLIPENDVGSIPARAGEPTSTRRPRKRRRVYPRTCGGTQTAPWQAWLASGLSPHVRGNRVGTQARLITEGSIPARAGEPLQNRHDLHEARVYPRTCGGTPQPGKFRERKWGLSPHVRGNPCIVTRWRICKLSKSWWYWLRLFVFGKGATDEQHRIMGDDALRRFSQG